MQSAGELMLGGLLGANHLITMEDLPRLVAEHAALVGFTETVIYVTDLQQQLLIPLPGQQDGAGDELQPIRIDTTLPGRAFRIVDVVQARHVRDFADVTSAAPAAEEAEEAGAGGAGGAGGARRLWVPLLDGTERIGVLGLTVGEVDDVVLWRVKQLASLISVLVLSKRPHSDSYSRLMRARPMTLSAEVLTNLLPPGTFATRDVVVSAALEPAYEVGGDAYDYGVDGDILRVSVFDAMGHDTSAGLTATIAMGACRNSRRQGTDLLEASEVIDAAIAEQFVGRFATGILARLNLRTGSLSWVNRGHHAPLVLREGRLVATLVSEPDPPMGFRLKPSTGLVGYQLQRGDRVLFYTDGIIEAQSPSGEMFGLERFIDFIIRREADGLPAPETLRRLIQAILEHQQGRLQDDATVVMVEWRGEHQDRVSL
jgi:hypothetical protein